VRGPPLTRSARGAGAAEIPDGREPEGQLPQKPSEEYPKWERQGECPGMNDPYENGAYEAGHQCAGNQRENAGRGSGCAGFLAAISAFYSHIIILNRSRLELSWIMLSPVLW